MKRPIILSQLYLNSRGLLIRTQLLPKRTLRDGVLMSKNRASMEDTLIALVSMRGWIVKKSMVTAAQLLILLIKHTGIAMHLMRIVIVR